MWLMWLLTLFILLGCVAIWRWGGFDIERPWEHEGETGSVSVKELIRRYVWLATLGVTAGLTSGLIMAGMGGRLAMRVLAATSSDAVQGRITEANEIVGRITTDGSIGFVLFVGAGVGLLSGALYMLIRRWLPAGRWGGFTFGAMLLVLVSTRIEPLRPGNEDFDIVGPGWLSVALFIAMGLGHGMLLAGLAGRYSRALPLVSKEKAAIAKHLPILFLLTIPPAIAIALVVGALYVLTHRVSAKTPAMKATAITSIGRALGAAVLLAALPGFVTGVADIVGRS